MPRTPTKTDEDKQAFLDEFRRTGRRNQTCELIGLSPGTFYRWLKTDEEFVDAFEEAKLDFVELLEAEAFRRAHDGIDKGVYYKGALVATEQQFSDALLLTLLKANAPEKYKDRTAQEVTGANGGPINVFVSKEQRDAAVAAALDADG